MQSTFGVVLKNFVLVFKSISVLDDPAQILEKQYYLKFMNEIGCHKPLICEDIYSQKGKG